MRCRSVTAPVFARDLSTCPCAFMALASVTFFVLAIIAVASAVGVLIARSPIYSALSLILNLLCVAGLYLTMNAAFIGVIQILVYAGAIMVLVLFVIMLLNLDA